MPVRLDRGGWTQRQTMTLRFGLFVIGDEILSGKRSDRHLPHVIELLRTRGLRLSWAQYLPDERALLVEAFSRSFRGPDVVFSCGGGGSSPDDPTRHAGAVAPVRQLGVLPEAAAATLRRSAQL